MTRATSPQHRLRLLSAAIRIAAFGVAAAICSGGCNDGRPQRVPVSGIVTIDGAPLANAFVVFYPHGGRSSNGRTDSSGRYKLRCFADDDGALVGSHQVTVIAVHEINPNTMKWFAPKKYADHKSSGLKCTVDKPTDDLNFALTWNGGKPFVERVGGGD